jgi:hypothetical protein
MMGASGPWDKLSENMRKTILYHHILEQVGQNLGYTLQDNTQIRLMQFNAALGDTRMALGQAFLPIIYTVLPALTAMMRHIERALQYVSAFMRTLFGIKTPFAKTNTALAETGGASLSAADGMKALGDETEKAGKKAKKAAEKAGQGLQSFDQVHLLAEQTADAASGGGGGGGGGGVSLPEPPGMLKNPMNQDSIYENMGDSVSKLAKKFRDFFETSHGWETMTEGASSLYKALKDIYESKVVQWMGKQIGEDLPDFFDDLMQIGGGALKVIAGGLELIASLLDNDMEKGWKGWGDIISGTWDIFAGTAGLIFPDFGKKLDDFGTKFERAWKWFGDEFIKGSETWTEAGRKFVERFKTEVKLKLAEIALHGVIKFEEMKEGIKKKLLETVIDGSRKWNDFKENAANSMNLLRTHSGWVMDIIKQYIGDRMREAWERFKAPFVGAYTWFYNNVISPISNAISGIGWGMDGAFGAGLRSIFNTIAHRINGMLGKLSGVGVAGYYPFAGITRYAIPNLAKGGIATAATLAVIGEGREDEAIAPLSKLQGFITNAVIEAMRFQGGGGTAPIGDIILNLDGRAFARIVKPHLERENKRVGTNVRLNPI